MRPVTLLWVCAAMTLVVGVPAAEASGGGHCTVEGTFVSSGQDGGPADEVTVRTSRIAVGYWGCPRELKALKVGDLFRARTGDATQKLRDGQRVVLSLRCQDGMTVEGASVMCSGWFLWVPPE